MKVKLNIQCHPVMSDLFKGSMVGRWTCRTGCVFLGKSLCPATCGLFPGSGEIKCDMHTWELFRVIHTLLNLE